jgi:hypothetical protein
MSRLEGRMARQLEAKLGKCTGMEEVKYYGDVGLVGGGVRFM